MTKQKATKKEIETVLTNVIREIEHLGRKLYTLDNVFGLYLKWKKEQDKFNKFMKEEFDTAKSKVVNLKENVNEPGETK
tara:strand:- start:21 stop:257 length:237 start_codon:yes stop_codon:yes gene_type:complete